MTELLIDQPSRDRIRTAFDDSLFVEAGAGTGKTTELVSRVVGLIESGRARIEQIVAITFTEAAAGELRERVRAKLEARLHQTGARGLQEAIDHIEDAPMQTIHGFANRLLQLYPTAVGLPPVFEVLDGTQSELAFDAWWRSVARQMFVAHANPRPDEERLLHMAWMLGGDLRKLRALAHGFREHAHEVDVPSVDPAFTWLPSVERVIKQADSVIAFQAHCKTDDDKMLTLLRNTVCPWHDQLRAALEAGDEFSAIELLRVGLPKTGQVGRATNWPDGVLQEVREACAAIEDERQRVIDVPRRWAMEGVMYLVADAVKREARRRVREGELEFSDLLVLADRLVQKDAVRRDIQSRYAYVFVDEFQDTDPIQTRLVQKLVTPVDGGEDRLFTVGDPKQSIYRFRSADLAQYLSMRTKYQHAVAELTTNFRTLPNILRWVDGVFAPLMAESLGVWTPLGHGRSGEHEGTVQIFGEAAEEGMLSAHVREVETTELAQRLQLARAQGWSVHDVDGTTRAIRYGDMAVLIPTRRSLANLERAFRHAGIPYRVESRSLIWSTQEVRDVVAILRVIDDALDEHAVVAALRSPAFACGDDELAAWRAKGGTWNVYDDTADDSVVGEAMLVLRSLRERARFMDVPAIVHMIIEDRGLFHSAFGHVRQREPWNRLRFIADQAQGWFDEGHSGLHAFLQWVRENQDLQAAVVESVVPEADDDAVRVMTIHAAKGLEFPLAAVIGLGSVPNSPDSVRVLWPHEDGRPEVRIGPQAERWQTPGFDEAVACDEKAEQEERLRLLYVAVTRARDHLLVGLHRTAKERQPYSLATLLSKACAEVDITDTPQCVATVQDEANAQCDRKDASGELERAKQRRVNALTSATRNVQFSATKIAQLVSNADSVLPVRTAGHLDADDLSYRLTLGSAVHKALEIISFDADAVEMERVAALVAIEFGLEGYEQTIIEAASKALRSAPVREAVASGRYWREVSVAKDINGVIVRGTIDLLYERDGGLVVVDYKTEAVPTPEAVHEATERYRFQLYTYATALQQEGIGAVDEVVLLFIPPGEGDATVVKLPAEGVGDTLRQALTSDALR